MTMDRARCPMGMSKRWVWYGLGAIGALIAAVAFFYLEEDWRGAHAWKQYKQQLQARGEPTDRSALVPPQVPDDQNFASTPFLAPLFDFEPGTQKTRDTNALDRTKSVSPQYEAASALVKPVKGPRSNSWVTAAIDLRAWEAAFSKDSNSAALPAASKNSPSSLEASANVPAARVLAALGESEPVIEELRAASLRPHSRFNIRYDNDDPVGVLLPHYATLKRVCQVLQLRASAELALGQTSQAFEDINLILRLMDSIQSEPLLIGHLVRIAELHIALQPLAGGLARRQWSEAQLNSFENRLLALNFCADARRALEGERVMFGGAFIDYLEHAPDRVKIFSNLFGGEDHSFGVAPILVAAVPHGWFDLEKVNYHRLFEDYMLPAVDGPARRVSPRLCRKAEEHLMAIHEHPFSTVVRRHQVFCGLLLPALSRALERTGFAQSAADSAALACALERYRLSRGQYPDTLQALAPDFIEHLPRDVMTGEPLKYRREPDGRYTLYSVGWNETDDGGKIQLSKSGESVDQMTGDWVWRLPVPQ